MANTTYVALKTTTVSTSVTSVTLSSIPQDYTDLVLVITSKNANSTNQPYIQFNSDTGLSTTNYSTISGRYDSGGTSASGKHSNNIGWYPVPGPGVGTTGKFQTWKVHIQNYSSSTLLKTGLSQFGNSVSYTTINSHLWRGTPAPITSITITAESGAGDIAIGSTFTVYGIKSENIAVAAKATGGYITSDSTYVYHTFIDTNSFTPTTTLSADILKIGGGGGCGANWGSGGGAGGVLLNSSVSLVGSTAYTVTVGGGGAGSSTGSGSNGADSNVTGGALSLTPAYGGGYGAGNGSANGGNGGSGGGASYSGTGGTAVSGQGNKGGDASPSPSTACGGGAGTAAVQNTSTFSGGVNPGIGTTAYSAWSLATGIGEYTQNNWYIAGGGADGQGGSTRNGWGGGGRNLTNVTGGGNGKASTGGGGGANGGGYASAGGSGAVIIRYLKA